MRKTIIALVALVMGVCFSQADEKNATINVNSKVKYQHVTGFGGFSPSPTWSYWLGNSEMDKLFGKGENQLGLNILRLYMANSKNAWNAGVANAKRAKKYGAFIFASPWSPPASWKSNNSDSNGGELLESHYKDWANFLNDYYKYMKQQGVEIDAVSIQNEPDWNASYQSCIWTGEKMAKFLKQYGNLIECKIIAPEAIHFTRNMHEPILNDADACEQLDILGGHFYGWDGSSYPLAAQKGKEVWMTEFLINERQQNDNQNINWKDDGFLFARSVNDAMLANMSAWVHYSLKRYYGCLGDGNYGTTDNQITKRGYILSHYAKYVSGTTRIGHSLVDNSGKLSSSAYLSETGDSVIVMVLNPSADSYRTLIDLPLNTFSGCRIVTTESQNMVKEEFEIDAAVSETEPALVHSVNVDVQPWSVSTFIFKKSSDRTDIEDNPVEGDVIFADNFDMEGASCVPVGWRTKSGNEDTRTAGSYSLGSRIMSFSPEGLLKYAFYFRSNTDGVGYITYGEENSYRLVLEPGNYVLSYSTVGWKATPAVTAYVKRVGGRGYLCSQKDAPKAFVSSNGSSSRITETSDYQLAFEVAEQGNHVLKWEVEKAAGGMNEVLVGNIKLVRLETNGIETVISEPLNKDNAIYDLSGRRVLNVIQPGIYIQQGKKIVIR